MPLIFHNFGSVRTGQTNIFFFVGLTDMQNVVSTKSDFLVIKIFFKNVFTRILDTRFLSSKR